MSGMARANPTIPGSVAMFASCSSERSASIAARSSGSAKTRAGTRMSGRESDGISQRVSSIRRSSDIEHRPRPDPISVGRELEPVVRDRLDEVRRATPSSYHGRVQAIGCELDCFEPFGYEVLGLGEEHEL